MQFLYAILFGLGLTIIAVVLYYLGWLAWNVMFNRCPKGGFHHWKVQPWEQADIFGTRRVICIKCWAEMRDYLSRNMPPQIVRTAEPLDVVEAQPASDVIEVQPAKKQ